MSGDSIALLLFLYIAFAIIPFCITVGETIEGNIPGWVVGVILFWPIFLPIFLAGLFFHAFISIFKYGFKTIGR
jgi:hypothetical protein